MHFLAGNTIPILSLFLLKITISVFCTLCAGGSKSLSTSKNATSARHSQTCGECKAGSSNSQTMNVI